MDSLEQEGGLCLPHKRQKQKGENGFLVVFQ
jgi:hypothetical protein